MGYLVSMMMGGEGKRVGEGKMAEMVSLVMGREGERVGEDGGREDGVRKPCQICVLRR